MSSCPLALPLIFAGIRTATVYVVATATLATFAGGGGLGDIIVNEPSYGTGGVIAGALTITVADLRHRRHARRRAARRHAAPAARRRTAVTL